MCKVRNEKIKDSVIEKPLEGKIENSRLSWYRYIKRMKDNSFPRNMFETEVGGRKTRGRPSSGSGARRNKREFEK